MKRDSRQTQNVFRNRWQADDKSTNTIKPFPDPEKDAKAANERIISFLRMLPKKEMKILIYNLQLSDDGLNFLREGIAPGEDDYEICAVVEEIKRDRLLDPFRDSGDHLNYTNF